jgi:uncharacterized Zn finger protein (UPF0148 family)
MNLNDEYVLKQKIYSQQKEYRQTPEGKLALRRAQERQLLKRMGTTVCGKCGECEFEVLNVYNGKTMCYNCRYRRVKVLMENEL